MNITELDQFNLGDAIKFNNKLNPKLWAADEHLHPEVRDQLLKIADDFREFLGVDNLQVKDVTISGSNAAYTYTPYSDVDLHLVVDLPEADNNEVYRELFDAKKYQYNNQHNFKIGPYDIELYVENANKPPHSQGIYSLVHNKWIDVPKRRHPKLDDISIRSKYEDLSHRIEQAVESNDFETISTLATKIKNMRQAGLDKHGEFASENLAYKALRNQGLIDKLYTARNAAKDQALSIKEKKEKPRFTYGFQSEDAGLTWDGVSPTTDMFTNETKEEQLSDEDILKDFVDFCVKELKIDSIPVIKLRRDPQWPVMHKTFGRYIDDRKMLEVAFGQRHIMDVLRTVAHELTHKHQHERETVPGDAGETGSPWENEANARAGVLMRDYGQLHPELFDSAQDDNLYIDESAADAVRATAVIACLLTGGSLTGCATAPQQTSTQQVLKTGQDIGRTVQTAKKITRAGTEAEVQQELRNILRGVSGRPEELNHSNILRIWRKIQGPTPVQSEPESPEYGPAAPKKRMPQYEGASGYIPTKAQAKDPRFSMALTKDIRPGQLGKEANKLKLKTDKQGHPQVANPNGLFEELMLQLEQFKKGKEEPWDRDGYEPPGPEFPPEWPEGTTKIDVTDLTDWYRLGMDISDMDDADPADYGKGPPQTVVVFPSDEMEQGYLDQFKRLGLKTHDIDPGGEDLTGKHQAKEAIDTPVNKNKDNEQYYKFIVAKHKLGRPLTRQEQEFVRSYKMFGQQVAESVEQLDEVKMSPSALQQWANSDAAQGIRAGFEAELIFRDTNSGDDDDSDMEPDYDMDERCRSISQVVEFFQADDYGYGLSERQAARLQEGLDEQYMEWMDQKMYDSWRDERDELIQEAWLREKPMGERVHAFLVDGMDLSDEEADRIQAVGDAAPKFNSSKEQQAYAEENPDYATYLEAVEGAEEILQEDVEQTIEKEDGFYDEVLDDFRSDFYMDDDTGFFDDVNLRYMSDVAESYDLGWPYLMGSGSNGGSRDWESIGDSLNSAIDMPVKVSSNYHSTPRKEGMWIVEPDSSLSADDQEDFGLEIVSPPMPLEQALQKLQQVTDWANNPSEGNAYTNESTGLHMGVSVPFKGGDVDYLKLILFLGDEYVLKSFGREANTYTKSAMSKFKENIRGGRADPAGAMKLMQSNLIEFAYREIQKGVGEGKYTSAHIQKGYIEFRSAGGDWLAEGDAEPGKLENTMLRYARAMQIAANPSEERKEYAKKLYKLIAPEGDSQLALFSQFAAGELTAEQLKKRWAEKTIGAEKKMNQRWKLYQNVDGRWEPVPSAEWNGYTEEQVKNAVWSKYGREALDSGEYQLVNMGEQDWEVYDVNTGATLEIVKGKSKGEVADAVYDKYVDQGIGFQVRPYEDPATMTPRAKLAKRIVAKKPEPRQVANQATNERGVPYWEIYSIKDDWNVIHTFLSDTAADAKVDGANWLTSTGVKNPNAFAVRPKIKTTQVKDVAPDVAQNFAQPSTQDATDVPRNWEFVNRINGQVIHNMTNASYNQANVVQDNLESRYPDADIFLRSVSNLEENFADGKGPGRPGDSQRHGIPKGATIAQLEKAAKAPGRKGQLARWQLNMRRGKKK
jgi:hypothetical protein